MDKDSNRDLITEFLREIPIFKSLSANYLSRLANDFTVVEAKKGQIIFNQSDSSTDLYIVLEGAVKASLLDHDSHELVLATFGKGNFFGELSLLDGKPRSATLIAVEDTKLGVLKREKFHSTIKRDPMIAIDLLSTLVQRLRTTNSMIESLAFLDVSQRLIKLFLEIAHAEGSADKNGFYRIKKLTHKDLAARTGASREAISKIIKVLVFKGVIHEEEDYFLISSSADEDSF